MATKKVLTAKEKKEFADLLVAAKQLDLTVSPNIGLDTLRKKVNAAEDELEDEEFEEGEEDTPEFNEDTEEESEDDLDDVDATDDLDDDDLLMEDAEEAAPAVVTKKTVKAAAKPMTPAVAKKAAASQSLEARLLAMSGSADDGRLDSLELNRELAKHQLTRAALKNIFRKFSMRLIRIKFVNMSQAKQALAGEYLTTQNSINGKTIKFLPFDGANTVGYHVPYSTYELMRDKQYYNPKVLAREEKTSKVVDVYANEYQITVLPPLTAAELEKIEIRQASQSSKEV